MASSSSVDVFKTLLMRRCIKVIGLSMAMQFLLLTIFLFFVNFNIFHLINWIVDTIRLVCSPYTWLMIIPLISAAVLYGVILGKMHMAEKRFYKTRYRWILNNATRKYNFLGVHVLVGFITAWVYSSYLHMDYNQLIYECYGEQCINTYYTLLISIGIFTACFHFVKWHLRCDATTEIPLVPQKSTVQLHFLLTSTIMKSLKSSIWFTICFVLCYWLVGGPLFVHTLGKLFSIEYDDRLDSLFAVITNVRLLFYAWILASKIICNMYLMDSLYSVLLTDELPLVITKSKISFTTCSEVTYVDALSIQNFGVIQCMAAYQFYRLSVKKHSPERAEIFELSVPGSHPKNWMELSEQCLVIIKGFTAELSDSMKQIAAMKENNKPFLNPESVDYQTRAEKILLREYNQVHKIRPIMNYTERCPKDIVVVRTTRAHNFCRRLNQRCEQFSRHLERSFHNFVRNIPGMMYMFSEPDGARTVFLLNNSQTIVWLIQGLEGLCIASIKEDRYGVVQMKLADIIKALANLKEELEKLNNININGKRLDRSFFTIRAAVRHSLYRICETFGKYTREIITDNAVLQQIQGAFNYHES